MPPSRTIVSMLRALRWGLAAAVGVWALCVLAILGWSQRNSADQADAILVLGAAQYDGRPSPVLRARLDHALALYRAGRAPRVVLTGGHQAGEQVSEAEAGARYLVRRGVPRAAMLVEVESRTSSESMASAASLLHVFTPNRPRVLLVSDPFHMLRLHLLARRNGLTPSPSPTRTSPISASPLVALEYVLRESVAIPAEVVGWVAQ